MQVDSDCLERLSKRNIRVCNLVVTAVFSNCIDLVTFAKVVGGTYRPKKFAAVRFRVRNPRCTILVFKSGKCVFIGCTKVWQVDIAVNQCFIYVARMCANVKLMDVRVQNIVTHTKLPGKLDLNRMYSENALFTNYNPELFPGLRMSLQEQNARASLFFQGNVIVTGCNTFGAVEKMWNVVEERSKPYLNDSSKSVDTT
eukprot:gene17913-21328_t